mgnify:CR=1 FL=1
MKDLNTGDTINNKKGKPYATVGEINGTGFWVVKSNGKTQRVSYQMVTRVERALIAGKRLKFQSNGPEGISYTLAIEAGVLHALRHYNLIINHETREIRMGLPYIAMHYILSAIHVNGIDNDSTFGGWSLRDQVNGYWDAPGVESAYGAAFEDGLIEDVDSIPDATMQMLFDDIVYDGHSRQPYEWDHLEAGGDS